jgi:3-carboxy-cis,cis-muconate cycloisomerase
VTTIDAGLLSPVRAGTPVERAVSDTAWLQGMLDAEAALTRAQATVGTVPAWAARAITSAARVVAEDNPAAVEYVHRGSTSQDIVNTGAMLVSAEALRIIRTDLTRTAVALNDVARRHRDTPMAGRTLALHAVPITFGLKVAGWRQLVLDARRRVDWLLSHGLPVALGGAAGTLAGLPRVRRCRRRDDRRVPGAVGRRVR